MIKGMGALLIIIASSWIGFELSRSFTERTKQLRILKSALQSLEAEIMFGHAPLHEASRRIARQIEKPIRIIFENFAENLINEDTTAKDAWEKALKKAWKQTALKKEEREILHHFGETLGKHDFIQQQKQIQLALTHLEREEVEAREKQSTYGKMMRNLGFLGGLLLILLLM